QEVGNAIERVERRIVARVREWVVQRSLIRNSKASAQRSLPIAKHVPGKAHARAEVIVISSTQLLGRGEASRTTLSRNRGQRIAGTWSTGILDLSRASRNVVDEILSGSLQERGCQVIQFGVPSVEVITDAQV